MKTIAILSLIIASHAVPFSMARQQSKNQSLNPNHIYLLRVDGRFRGGEVEVMAQNGDTILKEILNKRRMKIDFRNVKPGTYTIKLKKGMLVEQFAYQRK